MNTDQAYYRSLHRNEWKTVPTDEKAVAGVLYPDFYPRDVMATDKATGRTFVKSTRGADVAVTVVKGEEHVRSEGGTSLHNHSGAMTPAHVWREFVIPDGTPVPDGIRIVQRGRDRNHYQIEVASGMMEMEAFKGALDTLARAAIVRRLALRTA